jgi:hypothetical protein
VLGALKTSVFFERIYTHRIAISNNRLVAADDDKVSFRWKDYRRGTGTVS